MRRRSILILFCLGTACAGQSLTFGGAGWPGQPYSLGITEHVTAPGQVRSGSVAMTLEHDAPCMISVSVGEAGDQMLTCNGDTLTTSYKLTGASLQNPDTGWVGSQTFLTRTYDVQGNGPTAEITIGVRAAASATRANQAGTYSASVVLTVSW